MAGGRADVAAGKAYVTLYCKGNELTKGLKAAQKQLKDFGSQLIGVGAAFTGAGAAIGTSLFGALSHFADVGDSLDEMSARTGVAAGMLAELGYAADLSGSSLDDVEKALKFMAKSGKDVATFEQVAASIAAIEDPSARAKAAIENFGRAGTTLLPMLGSLKELRQEARDLGLSPSDESIKAAVETADGFDRIKKSIGAVVYEIGASLAPMAIKLMKSMVGAIQVVRKWITENRGFIVATAQVAAGLLIVGAAITTVGALMLGASVAIGGLLTIFSAIGTVIGVISSPMFLIGAAIVGIGYAAVQAFGGFRRLFSLFPIFGQFKTIILGTFKGIYDAIAGGDLALAGQIAFTGLKLVAVTAMGAISSSIGGIWGKAIGDITSKILDGDFAGVWNTVVLEMSAVWTTFSNEIVNIFAAAGNGIIAAFRTVESTLKSIVDSISDYMLKDAEEGGAFGALVFTTSGVALLKEKRREERLNREYERLGLDSSGGTIGKDAPIEADGILDSATAAINAAVERTRIDKAAAVQALNAAVGGGGQALNEDVAKLERELTALRNRAKNQRAKANASAIQFGPDATPEFGGSGPQSSLSASFSAAGLIALGQGGSESPVVRETRAVRKAIEKAAALAKIDTDMQIEATLKAGGFGLGA